MEAQGKLIYLIDEGKAVDLLQNLLVSTALELGLSLVPIATNFYEAVKPVPVVQVQKEDATNNLKSVPLEMNDQEKSKVEKAQDQAKQ